MGSQSWTRLKDFHFHFHCSITNHQSSATVTCVILQFTHINQPGQTHLYPSALGPGRQPSRCPPDSGSRVTRGHSQIHRGGWPQLPADNWQEAPQAPSDPSAPGGHRISRKQPRFLVAVWYQRASEAHASTEQSPSLCQTPQLRSQVGSHYAVRPGGLSTEVWRFPSAQPPRPFPGPEPWRAAGQRGPRGLLFQALQTWPPQPRSASPRTSGRLPDRAETRLRPGPGLLGSVLRRHTRPQTETRCGQRTALRAHCPPASLEPAPQVKARLLTGTSGHAHRLCTWAQGSHEKVGNLFSLLKAFRIVLKNLADIKGWVNLQVWTQTFFQLKASNTKDQIT